MRVLLEKLGPGSWRSACLLTSLAELRMRAWVWQRHSGSHAGLLNASLLMGGLKITKHRKRQGKRVLRLLKWLENHETSVFLSLKGFNYCLLLEFSQVVYYNEGAISRSAPIFRDFQAI